MFFTIRGGTCQVWIDPSQIEAIASTGKSESGFDIYNIATRSGEMWVVKYHSNLSGLVVDVRNEADKLRGARAAPREQGVISREPF